MESSVGDIYTGSYHCKQFVGKNFKMVDHRQSIRNKKVYGLMQELSKGDDPKEENAQHDGTISMPKRELFGRLPSILTIDVATTSMVTSVDVLPSCRTKGVLQIELTQPNLDLLLEEPRAESAPCNVYCIASRNMVRCTWWDSKKSKKRIKSMGVEFSSDMDDKDKLAAVISVAGELQEFYDTNHDLQNNMPGPVQYRETDDGVSAESTHGEPVQKAAKTD